MTKGVGENAGGLKENDRGQPDDQRIMRLS
jgi:hypothetical protein